jgi:hypothetical protein
MVFKRKQDPTQASSDPRLWNKLGRAHCALISQQVAALVTDPNANGDDFAWPHDPRNESMADAVWKQVLQLNVEGRANEARGLFDPAHEPFVPVLSQFGQSLSCITILGPDEYLFRVGSAYTAGTSAVHIAGTVITARPDILASAAAPNHDHFLFVKADGFWIASGLDASPTAHLNWMADHEPQPLDCVYLANDGETIALVLGDETGVWVGRASQTGGTWHRAYPTPEFLLERLGHEEDEDGDWIDSMMHCALSPDGRFVAYGSQCYGHFVDEILPDGTTRRWGEVGYHSEYPHNACFSGDSTFVAFNSCHFYNGATVASKLVDIEGAQTECYEESDVVTAIDHSLRVYASTWLPAGIAASEHGLFALAGLGYLNVADPFGKLAFRQEFGSSASSIDFCPKTRRLVLASYSGFIHVYDVDAEESPDRVCGYKARKELYRWVFWKDQQPFRW